MKLNITNQFALPLCKGCSSSCFFLRFLQRYQLKVGIIILLFALRPTMTKEEHQGGQIMAWLGDGLDIDAILFELLLKAHLVGFVPVCLCL